MRVCVVLALLAPRTAALLPAAAGRSRRTAARAGAGDGGEDYVNPVTALLGRFIPKPEEIVIDGVDFAAAKTPLDLPAMAKALDAGLRDREWFVTGRVLPNLFADGFEFKDPDVQLKGIDKYASGVARLFDDDARCEVISCEPAADGARRVEVEWRLSGGVKVGPGLTFKPYVVYTDLRLDDAGLVDFQEDRFSVPGWQILLGAVAPWLPVPEPAPPADELRARKAAT